MKKLIRDTSNAENAAFWDAVKKSAELVKDAPAWAKAGIDLNEQNFTFVGSALPLGTVRPGDRNGE